MVRLWAAPEQTAHPNTAGTETTVPPARSGALMEWLDRFLGSDPGLTRLRTALQAVVTIGAAMAAEWLFVRLTGALQTPVPAGLPADEAAGLAALNHALLVVAIMLGAVIGMLASFAGTMFTTARAQLITFVFLPVPMIAGLTLGLALGPYRVAALASLAVVLAVGTYARRFGPRGFMGGMVAFMGDFFGFFLHAQITLGDLGWLSAEIAVGIVVAAVAQFTLFYPSRRAALRRMMRSYTARARDVARRGLEVFDQPDAPSRARQSRRLHRRLVRLNEAALMIDAQLADPAGVPAGWSPTLVHQAIFDAELALTNLARFIEPLAELPLSADTRTVIRQALTGVAQRDLELADRAGRALLTHLDQAGPILLHRFAGSVTGLVAAAHAWQRATVPAAPGAGADGGAAATGPPDTLEAAVTLAAGWLPGSTKVSSTASQQAEDGRGFWDRIQLAPNVRVSIQMGVAVAGAIVFGDLLSGHRFYWAVIAAFVTFMGANNAGEQLRKGMYRVLGTMIGVVLGAIGAHLVDGRAGLAIAVILISMFFGLYLMRISYVFMVIAITIMVSQLYVELNEFSDSLLVLRLEETALGAAVAALTVLCVLPLRTGRVARVAAREYLKAITELTEQAIHRLLEPHDNTAPLRAAARRLDAAYQALLSTMTPLRVPFTGAGDNLRKQFLHAASAARHYARNLLVDTMNPAGLDDEQRARLRTAADQLLASLNNLTGTEEQQGPTGAQYVRSAALFDLVAQHGTVGFATPLQFALRDLQLIDGAMAAIAHTAGMNVQALDTSATEQPPARRAHRV